MNSQQLLTDIGSYPQTLPFCHSTKSDALPIELQEHIVPTLFILLWDGSRKVIVMIMAKLPRLELGHGVTRYYRFSRPTPYQLGLKLHWLRMTDSNRRPSAYEADELTTATNPQISKILSVLRT